MKILSISKMKWPAKALVWFTVICLLVFIVIVIKNLVHTNKEAGKEDEDSETLTEQTTTSSNEKVFVLEHGTYHVTIKPKTWTKIGPIGETDTLDTDGFGKKYQIKSDCQPKPKIIGGGLPCVDRDPCKYIYLSALENSEDIYIEYTVK